MSKNIFNFADQSIKFNKNGLTLYKGIIFPDQKDVFKSDQRRTK